MPRVKLFNLRRKNMAVSKVNFHIYMTQTTCRIETGSIYARMRNMRLVFHMCYSMLGSFSH